MSTLDSKQYKEAERQNWDSLANNRQMWKKQSIKALKKLLGG
ncbi:MAG: hypothetical protein WBL44_12280 [Nitrososphaeraceae archaeon]